MEWKEVTLGEIGTIVGGATPSTKNTSFYDGNIPWLTPKDLSVNGNKYIFRGERNITEAGFKSCSCKMLPKGSVLFSSRAPIGYVAIAANDMCTNQGFKSVIPNEETDSEFLYYLLKYNKDNIASQGSGTTFAEVSGKTMKDIEVVVPKEKEDQRRIASILSSLDRKIELNNKINADLEEMAQAIFKNWFVDFEPFKDGKFVDSELGMIPEGWKVISLSEIMKYNGGSQPPASEFIDTYQEGYIRFIQIRDYDNDSHITYIPISKRNKLCDELDIMIARYGAALGRICWGLKGAYNVALAKVTPIKSYYREYLRCYLNTSYFYQSINNKGARCAQSGFNQSDINSYMIAFPIDETVVMNFNDLCSSIMDKRLSLKYENSRLSTLRDTLLPRLMSGELEVPE